jgi:hypothetical protein
MTATPPPDDALPPDDAFLPDDAFVLDLAGVTDRQAFMDRCTERLRLPAWFGRNWDALADCLTDLSWWPAGPGGRWLRVRGWQEYAAAKPREWRIVKDILRDAETFWRDTDTELTVEVVEEDTNGGREDRDVRP